MCQYFDTVSGVLIFFFNFSKLFEKMIGCCAQHLVAVSNSRHSILDRKKCCKQKNKTKNSASGRNSIRQTTPLLVSVKAELFPVVCGFYLIK